MFTRVFALLPLALLVSANAHLTARDQCNTSGGAQCCDTTESQGSDGAQSLLAALGLVDAAANVDALVGLSCDPIVGNAADCSEEPVCCEDNYYNGLVNVGCSPINVNA